MRMTSEEHAMLEAFADASRVSAAHVVRELIRREHAKLRAKAERERTTTKGRAR